jgi:hypothetical protein
MMDVKSESGAIFWFSAICDLDKQDNTVAHAY